MCTISECHSQQLALLREGYKEINLSYQKYSTVFEISFYSLLAFSFLKTPVTYYRKIYFWLPVSISLISAICLSVFKRIISTNSLKKELNSLHSHFHFPTTSKKQLETVINLLKDFQNNEHFIKAFTDIKPEQVHKALITQSVSLKLLIALYAHQIGDETHTKDTASDYANYILLHLHQTAFNEGQTRMIKDLSGKILKGTPLKFQNIQHFQLKNIEEIYRLNC